MPTGSANHAKALEEAQVRYGLALLSLKSAATELRVAKLQHKRAEQKKKMEERKRLNAAARRERARQRFLERRTKGLCRSCGKRAAPSKRKNSTSGRLRFCETHQAVQLASQRKRTGAKPRKSQNDFGQEISRYGR